VETAMHVAIPKKGVRCPVCTCGDAVVEFTGVRDYHCGKPGCWRVLRCSRCRSLYIDPMPEPDRLMDLYAGYMTHTEPEHIRSEVQGGFWKRLRIKIRNGYLRESYGYCVEPAPRWGALVMKLLPKPFRAEWDHYARHLGKPVPGRCKLLDVGCGNGEFLLRARCAGWDVKGLEPDPDAAAMARKAGLDVYVGTVEEAPYEEGSFDVITSHQVIEHVPDPHVFLDAVVKWLRPGGTLWLGTPNACAWLLPRFGRHYVLLHVPYHLLLFSPGALIRALESQGLGGVTLVRRGIRDIHVAMESDRIRRGLHPYGKEKPTFKSLMLGFLGELLAWFDPGRGSDLVVMAVKPACGRARAHQENLSMQGF